MRAHRSTRYKKIKSSKREGGNGDKTFFSDSPTYLSKISGPLTTLGSTALSSLPICRAISVLPARSF